MDDMMREGALNNVNSETGRMPDGVGDMRDAEDETHYEPSEQFQVLSNAGDDLRGIESTLHMIGAVVDDNFALAESVMGEFCFAMAGRVKELKNRLPQPRENAGFDLKSEISDRFMFLKSIFRTLLVLEPTFSRSEKGELNAFCTVAYDIHCRLEKTEKALDEAGII